ncbi:MAG: hypothetical protein LBH44_07555 [Treponema sp.]|nr:hypothetical protein [Treponema sp.]
MDWADKIRCIEVEMGIENDRGKLASLLGVRPGIISDIKKGNSKNPGSNITLLLINKLGVNPKWLEGENQPIFLNKKRLEIQPNEEKILHEKVGNTTSKGHGGIPLVFEGDKEFEGGIIIPVLGDNPVSAGNGAGIGDEEIPTRFIHAPKELAKYLHLISLPVRGDSMDPTLHDGDMVVCDGSGWDGDGIYVIKTDEETFVKRVQYTSAGYRIVSDNRMYESYTEDVEKIAVVGKVRAAVVMMPGRRGGV